MDFKNLCQNIDVSSLRARIPSLPTIPQIKLPKSLPKLRSRRIFSRSREDLSHSKGSTKYPKQQSQQPPYSSEHLSAATHSIIPPSEFINHSPHRISTISSLMNQRESDSQRSGTYRSADSVDDDYPSPRQFQAPGRLSRHISPIHTPNERAIDVVETTAVKMTFSEKVQKGYKDFTEFRLSHIFAKKTVVRKDTIQVDHYVNRFIEDRAREQFEQEQSDQKIADNYRFDFKLSRQDTDSSKRSMSSNESPKRERHQRMPEQSEDESGMEATPPPRKPGIASTRFARVRNPPLEQHIITDESNNELNEDQDDEEKVVTVKKAYKDLESSPEKLRSREPESRTSKALHKLRSLSRGRSDDTPEKGAAAEKKRRAPLTPQQSMENGEQETNADHDNPLSALKQNIKRFSKSIRRSGGTTHDNKTSIAASNMADDTDGEGTPKRETKQISRTEKFTARLRKFASHEASTEQLDDNDGISRNPDAVCSSPLRTSISNKLQHWKKSFKRKPKEGADVQTGGEETSPEHDVAKDKETRSDKLMTKLRNLREPKRAGSTDELDDAGTEDETNKSAKEGNGKNVNFEERFEQARKRTLKKMNEKMQQKKLFHKSQENIDKADSTQQQKKNTNAEQIHSDEELADEGQSEDERTVYVRQPTGTAARRAAACDTPTDSEEEKYQQQHLATGGAQSAIDVSIRSPHTRTLWTTKNLLNESLDSETDSEFPRVLIHQDNSDQYESTLIIAVTRPAPPTTPILEEIYDDKSYPLHKPPRSSRSSSPGSAHTAEWIPNNEIISNFLEITPPSKRRLSAEAILPPPVPRGHHTRKLSMDSNSDSDSWIPENVRFKKKLGQKSKEGSFDSGTMLSHIVENEEPWKVAPHILVGDEKLYKAKSIDIFEASVHKGGVQAAFDDFEEELRNEPVLRVPQKNIDLSFEKDSSEEPFAADDDNSSRVTKISVNIIREEEYEEAVDISGESTKLIKLPRLPERKFCNSSESLIDHTADGERESSKKIDGYEDDDEGDDDDDDGGDDRPPSTAPSPPPTMSPPPLPIRKHPLIASKSIEISTPPPTAPPTIKPPMPPAPTSKPPAPPHIPDRTPSMARIAKPLVKTSSLRLAYDEQVKPADVGKVNKLISRFEIPQTNAPQQQQQRPRVIPRRLTRDESEEYSDDDDDDLGEEDEEEREQTEHDVTPTPTPTNTPRTYSLESDTESLRQASQRPTCKTFTKLPSLKLKEIDLKNIQTNVSDRNGNENQTSFKNEVPKITLNFDTNSNLSLSCASSEYGSPLEYPSSLIGSTETTPIPERKTQELTNSRNSERSRRSMTRENDKFLSFDSDDENSYYSISSTGSNRYVVEI